MMLFQTSPVVAGRIHALMSRAPEHERPPWLAVADHGCTYAIVLQGEGAFIVPSGAPAILRVEVKARAKGFAQLYAWLEGRDALVIKADRRRPLVVLPLALALEVMRAAENERAGVQFPLVSAVSGSASSSSDPTSRDEQVHGDQRIQ